MTPQGEFERQFMLEELDPFDFDLAQLLGRTVEEMRHTIGNAEYLQWRALTVYRNAQAELEREHARAGLSGVPNG